ncbi:MAG: DUF4276 family protein [Chloroflexota bacterium]|nr:DUF4276 family protein [Chloroflexota bacterium]
MHLVIMCEGHLEKSVLKTFLNHYWKQRFDTVEVNRYNGAGDLYVRYHGDARLDLQERDTSVLCLLDLDQEPSKRYRHLPAEQGFVALKTHMEAPLITQYPTRFAVFPVVWEIETWILADEKVMRDKIRREPLSLPEQTINPKAFLQQYYRSNYKEAIDGVMLFQSMSAKRVYDDHCPYFRSLIEWLITEPPTPPDDVKQRVDEKQRLCDKLQISIHELDKQLDQAMQESLWDKADRIEAELKKKEAEFNDCYKVFYL